MLFWRSGRFTSLPNAPVPTLGFVKRAGEAAVRLRDKTQKSLTLRSIKLTAVALQYMNWMVSRT